MDSPHVHQAWVNAPATEHDEADGLGRMPPFPLLGDKNMRFCRSLGVLDEATSTARHALYLINADGDLVFREAIQWNANPHFLAIICAFFGHFLMLPVHRALEKVYTSILFNLTLG